MADDGEVSDVTGLICLHESSWLILELSLLEHFPFIRACQDGQQIFE